MMRSSEDLPQPERPSSESAAPLSSMAGVTTPGPVGNIPAVTCVKPSWLLVRDRIRSLAAAAISARAPAELAERPSTDTAAPLSSMAGVTMPGPVGNAGAVSGPETKSVPSL